MVSNSALSIWSDGKISDIPANQSYTMQVLVAICERNDVPAELLDTLSEYLEGAAYCYSLRNNMKGLRLTNKQIKEKLEKINSYAAKLAKELEALNSQVMLECTNSLRILKNDVFKSPDKAPLAMITAHEKIQRFEQLSDYSAITALVTEHALDNLLPSKAGRHADEPVFVWVKMVSQFWIHHLNRPCRMDNETEGYRSAFGHFLEDCLRPLDEGATPKLSTQIRNFIQSES